MPKVKTAAKKVTVRKQKPSAEPKQEPILGEDAKTLQIFAKRVTKDKLHSSILGNALSNEDSASAIQFLDKLGFKDEIEKARSLALESKKKPSEQSKSHCVRCHKTYREVNNGPHSCRNEHDGDLEEGNYRDGYTYYCSMCGQYAYGSDSDGGDADFDTKWCWDAPHTTEEKDIGDSIEGHETCEELGCNKRLSKKATIAKIA